MDYAYIDAIPLKAKPLNWDYPLFYTKVGLYKTGDGLFKVGMFRCDEPDEGIKYFPEIGDSFAFDLEGEECQGVVLDDGKRVAVARRNIIINYIPKDSRPIRGLFDKVTYYFDKEGNLVVNTTFNEERVNASMNRLKKYSTSWIPKLRKTPF